MRVLRWRLGFPFKFLCKKNNMTSTSHKRQKVREQEDSIRGCLLEDGLRAGKLLIPLDHEVELRVLYDTERGVHTVEVFDCGPRDDKWHGWNDGDVPNMGDLICDVLEGWVYKNDKQIRRVVFERGPGLNSSI